LGKKALGLNGISPTFRLKPPLDFRWVEVGILAITFILFLCRDSL